MHWRRKREQDLARELRSHLELEAEEQPAHLTPDQARHAARRALGNPARIQEATREAWGLAWLDRLLLDLRYGCRAFRHNPGFASVAILTAALGIGANTSIFSVVNAVLLHPLPYPDAARLVSAVNFSRDNYMGLGVADFQYATWRDQAGIFDGIAAYAGRRFTITGSGEPEQLRAEAVTPGFLQTMRTAPLIGRDFSAADAAPRGGRVAILSHAFWTRRFSGDPSVLSRQITLDGKPYSVAGVLPHSFEFPENSDTSLLVAMTEPASQPGGPIYFYSVIACLKRGVTVPRAQSDLALINRRLEPAYVQRLGALGIGSATRVMSLHDRLVGDVRPALLVLSGAVALVLLIVCVNISNLLLARAISRQREIAVRIALGAGRGRVLRQLLTEGMLLAGAGGAAGLALALAGVRLLRAIAPAGVPHIDDAHIGGAVLAFNLAIAFASGILFGFAPLRGASGIDPDAAMKQTARSTTGSRRHRRLESLLIVTETAFALILLAGAGLLMRTFAGLTSIPPGFHPERVVTAGISLPNWKYPTAGRRHAFLDDLLEQLRSGPGVDAAGATAVLPYGGFMMTDALQIDGRPAPEPPPGADTSADQVAVNYAAGNYFEALGIPIVEGRAIAPSDRPGRPAVAVVNQTLARRFFPGESPVGRRVRIGSITEWLEIVGVAGDVKQGGLASQPRAEIFQAAAQAAGSNAQTFVLRSTADPRILIPWLRARIAAADADLPPPTVETIETRMAALVASQLFVLRLLAVFAAIAITLAAIGIYSVLVYTVEQRTHEIGIRLALGARRAHIMGLVLGRGLRLSLAGAVAGAAGALALTRYLESLLYGVTPHDPLTLAAGCGVVIVVALGAAWFPARRAVARDPIATLRAE